MASWLWQGALVLALAAALAPGPTSAQDVSSCAAPCAGAPLTSGPALAGTLLVASSSAPNATACRAYCTGPARVVATAQFWVWSNDNACRCFQGCRPAQTVSYAALGSPVGGFCPRTFLAITVVTDYAANDDLGNGTIIKWLYYRGKACNIAWASLVNATMKCPLGLHIPPHPGNFVDDLNCTVFNTLLRPGDCYNFRAKWPRFSPPPKINYTDDPFTATSITVLPSYSNGMPLGMTCNLDRALYVNGASIRYRYQCRLSNRGPTFNTPLVLKNWGPAFISTEGGLQMNGTIRTTIAYGDVYTFQFTVPEGDVTVQI